MATMAVTCPSQFFLNSFALVPSKHVRAEALRQEVPADGVALYHVSAKVGTMSRLALGRRDELDGKRGVWRGSASVAMERLYTIRTLKQETLGTFCGRLASMHWLDGWMGG